MSSEIPSAEQQYQMYPMRFYFFTLSVSALSSPLSNGWPFLSIFQEFNFQAGKRTQHDLPTELFSKVKNFVVCWYIEQIE